MKPLLTLKTRDGRTIHLDPDGGTELSDQEIKDLAEYHVSVYKKFIGEGPAIPAGAILGGGGSANATVPPGKEDFYIKALETEGVTVTHASGDENVPGKMYVSIS